MDKSRKHKGFRPGYETFKEDMEMSDTLSSDVVEDRGGAASRPLSKSSVLSNKPEKYLSDLRTTGKHIGDLPATSEHSNIHGWGMKKHERELMEMKNKDEDDPYSVVYRVKCGTINNGAGHSKWTWRTQKIPTLDELIDDKLLRFHTVMNGPAIPLERLTESRVLIYCPDSTCGLDVFYSDLGFHMYSHHSKIPHEKIGRKEPKDFIIDPRKVTGDTRMAVSTFLLIDKVLGMGRDFHKDLLPIVIMSAWQPADHSPANKIAEHLLIWATTFEYDALPMSVTLSAWAPPNSQRKGFVTSHTAGILNILKSYTLDNIINNPNVVHIPPCTLKVLSNNGQDPINMQVIVH